MQTITAATKIDVGLADAAAAVATELFHKQGVDLDTRRILIVAALTPPTTKYKHLKSMTEDGALLSHALQQYGGWVPYMQFLDPAASPRSSATVDSALLSGTAEFISSTVKRVLAAARSPALGVVHQVVIVWLSHGGIESGSRGRGQFVLADDGKRLYLDELEALADRYKVALLQLINACRVACKSGHSNTRSKGSSSQSVPASRSGDWSNGHWLRLNATETWRESYGMLNAEVSPIAAEFLREYMYRALPPGLSETESRTLPSLALRWSRLRQHLATYADSVDHRDFAGLHPVAGFDASKCDPVSNQPMVFNEFTLFPVHDEARKAFFKVLAAMPGSDSSNTQLVEGLEKLQHLLARSVQTQHLVCDALLLQPQPAACTISSGYSSSSSNSSSNPAAVYQLLADAGLWRSEHQPVAWVKLLELVTDPAYNSDEVQQAVAAVTAAIPALVDYCTSFSDCRIGGLQQADAAACSNKSSGASSSTKSIVSQSWGLDLLPLAQKLLDKVLKGSGLLHTGNTPPDQRLTKQFSFTAFVCGAFLHHPHMKQALQSALVGVAPEVIEAALLKVHNEESHHELNTLLKELHGKTHIAGDQTPSAERHHGIGGAVSASAALSDSVLGKHATTALDSAPAKRQQIAQAVSAAKAPPADENTATTAAAHAAIDQLVATAESIAHQLEVCKGKKGKPGDAVLLQVLQEIMRRKAAGVKAMVEGGQVEKLIAAGSISKSLQQAAFEAVQMVAVAAASIPELNGLNIISTSASRLVDKLLQRVLKAAESQQDQWLVDDLKKPTIAAAICDDIKPIWRLVIQQPAGLDEASKHVEMLIKAATAQPSDDQKAAVAVDLLSVLAEQQQGRDALLRHKRLLLDRVKEGSATAGSLLVSWAQKDARVREDYLQQTGVLKQLLQCTKLDAALSVLTMIAESEEGARALSRLDVLPRAMWSSAPQQAKSGLFAWLLGRGNLGSCLTAAHMDLLAALLKHKAGAIALIKQGCLKDVLQCLIEGIPRSDAVLVAAKQHDEVVLRLMENELVSLLRKGACNPCGKHTHQHEWVTSCCATVLEELGLPAYVSIVTWASACARR